MILITCPHCGEAITLYVTNAPLLLNEYNNICPHCQKEYNVIVVAVKEQCAKLRGLPGQKVV